MTLQRRHRANHGRHFAFKNQILRFEQKLCPVCGQLAASYYVDHQKQLKTWRHATIVKGRMGKRINGEAKYCTLPIDKAAAPRSGS